MYYLDNVPVQALNPDQVVAVHIDNGFMRKNESASVMQSLERLDLRLTGVWPSAVEHCSSFSFPVGFVFCMSTTVYHCRFCS